MKIRDKIITALMIIPLLSACNRNDMSVVTIKNESSYTFYDVEISDRASSKYIGDIKPREFKKFEVRLSGEGPASISWKRDGKLLSVKSCYYSVGFPFVGVISIESEDIVEYKCSNLVS